MDHQFVLEAAKKRPRVLEDYEFNEHVQIGRGSYGQVYKAREKTSTNNSMTFYALKEVELTSYSPSTCREIALYRELKHRNMLDLLKVYFSHSAQKAWLLFDYAEYDLHSIIKFYRTARVAKSQYMPNVMQKSCLYQILEGVRYLHDNWILHRDLKPENILVMGEGPEQGCIKIADMGMARTFHSPMKPLSDVDAVVVTTWYRAPELLLGSRHYTKAIDIFSIGCIFAELLTNVPIFANSEIVSQAVRSPYQRNQLDKMFSVLGYPTLSTWSDLKHIPEYAKMQKELMRSKYHHCTLAKYMRGFSIRRDEASYNLLSKMLTIDPKKRISSIEAMCHSYFKNPSPSFNAFSCFFSTKETIPFPYRKYLSKKIEPAKFEQKTRIIRKTHLQERNI